MTDEEICNRLAIEVMGWGISNDKQRKHRVFTDSSGNQTIKIQKDLRAYGWNPVIDIEDAMMVAEKIKKLRLFHQFPPCRKWEASFKREEFYDLVKADTASRAICLAAIKFLENKK